MRTMIKKDDAVSPVVGVMLMLVVTIIIAAVVSGFAGGVIGNNQKAPQASVVATDFVVNGVIDTVSSNPPGTNAWGQGLWQPDQGEANAAADIYVVFEHKGGDSLNLDTVELQLGKLSEPQLNSMISRSIVNQTGPYLVTSGGTFGTIGDKSLISGFSKSWSKYLEKFPDRTSTVIKPGDRFILHADYGAIDVSGNKQIAWLQQNGAYPFPIKQGDVLTYNLMDKNSKKVICSGQIAVPEFPVRTS